MSRRSLRRAVTALLLTAAAVAALTPAAHAQSASGAPVLVVVDPADNFGDYYAEILRGEGMNEFDVANVGTLSAATLAPYRAVVLAETDLTAPQGAALSAWVNGGGSLIAMRPDAALSGLLGLGTDAGDVAEGYLQVAPGRGITGETMQFHGTADRWTGVSAATVATLFSTASSATTSPAVTLRTVGSGQAAAFTYDLARSVVETRQGNPAVAGLERDGESGPIRSDDLFFAPGEPSWVDMDKVAIPQADEQQRLLADLLTEMTADRMPLPRFWYLPRGEKAAVVMTGDDHNVGNTTGQFESFEAASPANCSVANWECIRSTSYVFPDTRIPGAEAFEQAGFEIALHLDTGCGNFTRSSLRDEWEEQLAEFRARFPTLDTPLTNRTHCIAWSDWASEPIVARENGVRLDTNYYYWPEAFVQNRPGMFTGSGMPQRFADADGSLIDVYQATTQMTDESGIDYADHIAALLDGALGPQGYYGVFTANMHTDFSPHPGANAIVAAAKARGVPVVSARQMLAWLDGRNGSSFQDLTFTSNLLRFSIARGGAGANGLQAMLPVSGPTGALSGITRGGTTVPTSARTVKGVDYLVFDAAAGAYTATYGDPPPEPPTTPETTVTAFTVTGSSASAAFTADVTGATFECSLDGAAFAGCGSPASFAGLADGQHSFRVRAVNATAVDPTPAERTFSIVTDPPPTGGDPPPGGGESGGGQPGGTTGGGQPGTGPGTTTPAGGGVLSGDPVTSDRSAPRMVVRTRRVRAGRTGIVPLRVTCPEGETRCRVRLRLRFGGRILASRSQSLAGGQTKTFRLQLRRAARRQLADERSLRITAAALARDDAGNEATVRTTVRLLAPRRR